MVAWLTVSICSGIPNILMLGLALYLIHGSPLTILVAGNNILGLAAAVIAVIDFRIWQYDKATKKTRYGSEALDQNRNQNHFIGGCELKGCGFMLKCGLVQGESINNFQSGVRVVLND